MERSFSGRTTASSRATPLAMHVVGERANSARGDAAPASRGQQPVADLDPAALLVVVVQRDAARDLAAARNDQERIEEAGRPHRGQLGA